MRPLRTIAVFPTLLTLGNLVCGFFAIVVAARVEKPEDLAMIAGDLGAVDNCRLSGWLILLAMVFDALDGYVARLAKTTSDFGAELDSLCDCVSFGVAPAFLLVKICPRFTFFHDQAVWIIAASFAACAAMRLARFNVETAEEDDHMQFTGLPSPAAAATIASFAIMFHTLRQADNPLAYAAEIDVVLQSILPYFAVLVALLMVSRIPYPHIVNQVFRGQRSFAHVIAVVFAVGAVTLVPGYYALPIITTAMVVYGPARWCWERFVQHKQRSETIF
jgi:CDP-diacylglycerol--serine O-phosphatidyltransferase